MHRSIGAGTQASASWSAGRVWGPVRAFPGGTVDCGRVQVAQLPKRHAVHESVDADRPAQGCVVDDDGNAIARQVDVEFNPVYPLCQGKCVGGQGVLGHDADGATMPDDERPASANT